MATKTTIAVFKEHNFQSFAMLFFWCRDPSQPQTQKSDVFGEFLLKNSSPSAIWGGRSKFSGKSYFFDLQFFVKEMFFIFAAQKVMTMLKNIYKFGAAFFGIIKNKSIMLCLNFLRNQRFLIKIIHAERISFEDLSD